MASDSIARTIQDVSALHDVHSNRKQDRSRGWAAKRGAKLGAAVVLGYVSLALTTLVAGMVPHLVVACAEAVHKFK